MYLVFAFAFMLVVFVLLIVIVVAIALVLLASSCHCPTSIVAFFLAYTLDAFSICTRVPQAEQHRGPRCYSYSNVLLLLVLWSFC